MLFLKLTHSLFFYSLCGNRIQLFQPTCARERRSHFQRVHHLGPNHESGQLRQGQAERSRDTWMLLSTPQHSVAFQPFSCLCLLPFLILADSNLVRPAKDGQHWSSPKKSIIPLLPFFSFCLDIGKAWMGEDEQIIHFSWPVSLSENHLSLGNTKSKSLSVLTSTQVAQW